MAPIVAWTNNVSIRYTSVGSFKNSTCTRPFVSIASIKWQG